jgi:predicted ATP-dependent serine protease
LTLFAFCAHESLLGSTNELNLFRGGAGTGKSLVLRELATQVQQNGRAVVVLAPQRQQVVDMEAAGFPSPTSVTAFLQKRDVPSGAVIVVDEAVQIGGRQMLDLLRLAHQRQPASSFPGTPDSMDQLKPPTP